MLLTKQDRTIKNNDINIESILLSGLSAMVS